MPLDPITFVSVLVLAHATGAALFGHRRGYRVLMSLVLFLLAIALANHQRWLTLAATITGLVLLALRRRAVEPPSSEAVEDDL